MYKTVPKYFLKSCLPFLKVDILLKILPMNNLIVIILMVLFPLFSGAQTVQENVYFDFDKYTILPAEASKLDELAAKWKSNPMAAIKMSGHTDGIGENVYNDWLAMQRTTAVLNYLVDKGVKKESVVFSGFGETKPVAENNSSVNRAKNRRVEIELVLPPAPPLQEERVVLEKEREPEWPPIDGILVKEGNHVYKDLLDRNLIEINCVMNTEYMDELMTTQTVNHEDMSSNVYICVKKPPGVSECELKEPIKLYLPVNPKSYCAASQAKMYDSETDSSGNTVWKEVKRPFKIEVHENQEYFVFTVSNLCGPCINLDCCMPSAGQKMRKRLFVPHVQSPKIQELESNSMLVCSEYRPQKWNVNYIHSTGKEKPILHFQVRRLFGKTRKVEAPLDKVKFRRGKYVITRGLIRKYKV